MMDCKSFWEAGYMKACGGLYRMCHRAENYFPHISKPLLMFWIYCKIKTASRTATNDHTLLINLTIISLIYLSIIWSLSQFSKVKWLHLSNQQAQNPKPDIQFNRRHKKLEKQQILTTKKRKKKTHKQQRQQSQIKGRLDKRNMECIIRRINRKNKTNIQKVNK